MSAPVLRIDTRAGLYDAIATLEQVGARHRVVLLRALLSGRIAHYECQRSTSTGTLKRFFSMVEKPALVLIGADDYAPGGGPDAWPCADRALRWARHVIVHAAGATVEQYEGIVRATVAAQRVVLIEAASAHADAWAAKVKALPHRPNLLLVLPHEGDVHPVVPKVRQ